jgi:alkyl sulfatase BDS1-like metallo-beta-lactamase superfamily hydrolase
MTTAEPVWHHREDTYSVLPAKPVSAVDLGDGIWMSKGLSNAYLLPTTAGRVIVNCGMGFESPYHRAAFDAVDDSPIHTIILTQGHPDHFGGVDTFLGPGTELITQANFYVFRTDFEKLADFRQRNASFAWAKQSWDVIAKMMENGEEVRPQSSPSPTRMFEDELELEIGGRRLRLISTPGGETTDACVVWLPEERVVLAGNLLGPLFGHVPNLVTLRGDRYRDVADYVGSIQQVRDLRPERYVSGHFMPIEGADLVDRELARLQDAMQWLHDAVIDGMNAGKDVQTLMRELRLPDEYDVGQHYGKVSWNVRAIWETYVGWFHHQSTTELYDVPAHAVAGDVVNAAGASSLVAAARGRLDAGEAPAALHLTDIVLAADPDDAQARAVAIDAHQLLLAASTNFWETAWLRLQLDQLGA